MDSVVDAFPSIDAGSLIAALNSCKASLDSSGIEGVTSGLSNSSVWKANSATKLNSRLTNLTGSKYSELKGKIDAYLGVANQIQSYKDLLKEVNELITTTNQLVNANNVTKGKLNQTSMTNTAERTKLSNAITANKNKIDTNKLSIEAKKTQLKTLENQIKGSV